MAVLAPFNLQQWIDDNRDLLKTSCETNVCM
jgi:hypothetical protein